MGLHDFIVVNLILYSESCFFVTLPFLSLPISTSGSSGAGLRTSLNDVQNFCRCGFTTESTSASQGNTASSAPWEAVILRRNQIDYNLSPTKICSGSILNGRMILTSVSCAKMSRVVGVPFDEAKLRKLPTLKERDIREQLTTANLEVWVGVRNQSFLNDTGGEMLTVKEIIAHPNYTEALGSIPDWDYAILVLEKDIEFFKKPNLSPACILPSNTPIQYSGQPVRSYFWKFVPPTYDTINLRVEPTLLVSSLTASNLFPNKQCKEKSLKKEWISERYICSAEGVRTNSGSGHFIQFGNNVPVLVGVGSFNSLYGTVEKRDLKQIALLADLTFGRSFLEDNVLKMGLSTCKIDSSITASPPGDQKSRSLDEIEPKDFSVRPWLQFTSEYRKVLSGDRACRCGLRKKKPSSQPDQLAPYIWHGQDFDTLYEYNWHANIGECPNPLGKLVCGGSIINDKMVLTAAHCINFEGSLPEKRQHVKWRGKDNYCDSVANDTYAKYTFVNPDAQAIHPDYLGRNGTKRDGKSYPIEETSFDVGILVLNNSLEISNTPDIGAACLPFTQEFLKIEGVMATVIGNGFWHVVGAGGFSTIPQKLAFTISDLNDCRKQWFDWHQVDSMLEGSWTGYDHILADTIICDGEPRNENYTGQAVGDSGSSVFIKANKTSDDIVEQMIQVGIVSSGVARKIIEYAMIDNVTLPEDPRITQLMTGVMDQETLSYIDYLAFYLNVSWCSRG